MRNVVVNLSSTKKAYPMVLKKIRYERYVSIKDIPLDALNQPQM
jgi:hypothetical protein